jgi:hypothetical protein
LAAAIWQQGTQDSQARQTPAGGAKDFSKLTWLTQTMKNHLTKLPFFARATRAAGAGFKGWVNTLAGRWYRRAAEAGNGPAAERLYRLAARLPQTGNFLPLKRPFAAYA